MKDFRLNRLLHAGSGRCLAVALDQRSGDGLDQVVRGLANAGLDALELTIGQAALLQQIPGRQKPALILRTDVTNIESPERPNTLFSRIVGNAVEQAVRLDAAAVVVNLLHLPGEPRLTHQCLENIRKVKGECEHWCLPLIIEARALKADGPLGGLAIDAELDHVLPLIRQAVELGADLIQAELADDLSAYHRVVEAAGRIPLLVRNGQALDAELLARTEKFIQQGAAGIIDGRNITEHSNTAGLTRALMAIVHDHATAADATRLIKS